MNSHSALLTAAITAIVLSGCSTLPGQDMDPNLSTVRDSAIDGWNAQEAVITRARSNRLQVAGPTQIPRDFLDIPIELELYGEVSLSQVVSIIGAAGVPVTVSDQELLNETLFMPLYSGSVGKMVSLLSRATDFNFSWEDGALFISKTGSYLFSIPQNEEIVERVSEALGSLGATDIQASLDTGTVTYQATANAQRQIGAYLERLSTNSAVVNLQLAVVNVNLDRESRNGFDWSSLSLQAGELGMLNSSNAGGDAVEGMLGSLSGSNAALRLASENLSLTGVLNLLSTYGHSQTMQNVTLKTLSSIEVALKSGDKVPYISGVSMNIGDSGVSSGATIEEFDTGFDIKIVPHVNAEDAEVTLGVTLSMKNHTGWTELSAGEGFGTLSYPQIMEQSFESIVRLDAGDTALIGGLVYESESDSRSTLSRLESLRVGSKSARTSKNAMFILVRPTLVIFE